MMSADDERALRATIENLIKSSATQNDNLSMIIRVVAEHKQRIEVLERARAMKPALVDAVGVRLN